MDTPTAPTDWRTVLREQGRNMTWLAEATKTPRRTVYAYGSGQIKTPPTQWLEAASKALGQTVTA